MTDNADLQDVDFDTIRNVVADFEKRVEEFVGLFVEAFNSSITDSLESVRDVATRLNEAIKLNRNASMVTDDIVKNVVNALTEKPDNPPSHELTWFHCNPITCEVKRVTIAGYSGELGLVFLHTPDGKYTDVDLDSVWPHPSIFYAGRKPRMEKVRGRLLKAGVKYLTLTEIKENLSPSVTLSVILNRMKNAN